MQAQRHADDFTPFFEAAIAVDDKALRAAFVDAAAAPRSPFQTGDCLFRQGDAARLVHRIVSGAVISYRILSDGRRQVSGFHLPGDFLGLEAGVEHAVTAEALTPVEAVAVERKELSARAACDAGLAQALWRVSIQAFRRSEDHAMILARLSAAERVAAFLVEFARRIGDVEAFDLPMTRQDIADYLGMTIHTVSRTLSQMQERGLIEARSSRHIRLLRRECLETLCA